LNFPEISSWSYESALIILDVDSKGASIVSFKNDFSSFNYSGDSF